MKRRAMNRWRWAIVGWAGLCFLLLLGATPTQGPTGPCPGVPLNAGCVRDYPSPLAIGTAGVATLFVVGVVVLVAVRYGLRWWSNRDR